MAIKDVGDKDMKVMNEDFNSKRKQNMHAVWKK